MIVETRQNMPKDNGAIDFGRLKRAAPIDRVLALYDVSLKRSGPQLIGCCPIHRGTNPRAFVVSTTKNAWRCFGDCNRGGNVIDLVAALETLSPTDAAHLLAERLGIDAVRPRVRLEPRRIDMSSNMPSHKVFVVEGEGEDAFWTRVGSAWVHKDGKGFNVTLSALPVNGRLVLREPNDDEDDKTSSKTARRK